MSKDTKKDSKDAKKKVEEVEEQEEELEEEEEDEEGSDDDDDEEEDEDDGEEERDVAKAKPALRRATPPKQEKHDKKHDDHGGHGHGHDDEDDEGDLDDPTWWAPYAVMTTLVLIGVLGFFGVFNKPLAFLAAKPAGGSHSSTATHEDTHKGATTPPPSTARPNPHAPHGQQADQQPREMFGAKHLLVMYKGSRRAPPTIERSKEDAKTRATEAMKKAKAPGAKFEDLVREYSDEPNAGARGGDLGKFPRGAMVPEFQTALDKMKVGEVSELVETPFGYHVILRTQ